MFDTELLIFGAIVLVGFFSNLAFKYTKIPEALFLVVTGLIIGPVLGIVNAAEATELMALVSILLLIVVMLDNGLSFNIFSVIKALPATLLFSFGVIILTTAGITALLFYSGTNFITAAIIAFIITGTTSDVLTILINKMKMPRNTKQLIIFDSIINDIQFIPFFALLVISTHSNDIVGSILFTALGIPFSILAGFATAVVWVYAIGLYYGKHPLNYPATIGVLLLLYFGVKMFSGSGPIAVLTFSMVLGNAMKIFDKLKLERDKLQNFTPDFIKVFKKIETDVSFFIRTVFFVLLGTIFSFESIQTESLYLLAYALVIIIFARFICSLAIGRKYRAYRKSLGPMTWLNARGYVAAVLAFTAVSVGVITHNQLDFVVLVIYSTTIISIIYAIYYEHKK